MLMFVAMVPTVGKREREGVQRGGEGEGDEMAPEGGQMCSAVCTQKVDHLHTKCMSIPTHERVRVHSAVRVERERCPM